MLVYLCWIGLILSGIILVYQDFKSRLINTWLIILFTLSNVCLYLISYPIYQFIENTIFCISYFLFCYLILHLYFYLKTKTFQKILDTKLGSGDILIFLSIGICIEPIHLIFFFTGAFIISIISFAIFFRSKPSIPLVGLTIPCYWVYFLIIQN
jgi:hypothetical protein